MNRRDAGRVLAELKRKAKLVKWHNCSMKERFGIIAKKIEAKGDLQKEGSLTYDLEDIKEVLKV